MKLIVLSGLSGSGKSTKAAEIRAADPLIACVEYDDIRRRWSKHLQPFEITVAVIRVAAGHLKNKRSVLVDACNSHPHDKIRWEAVAWAYCADLEWIEVSTPVDECIDRDSRRADPGRPGCDSRSGCDEASMTRRPGATKG